MTRTNDPELKKAKAKGQRSGASTKSSAKRKRRVVEVVTCPSAFPISNKAKTKSSATLSTATPSTSTTKPSSSSHLLDFHDTAHEIRHFGLTGAEGRQKKDYEAEQYQRLTGRVKRHHAVPLPIVRGIRRKAEKRRARQLQEAKEAGIVLPTTETSKRNSRKSRSQQERETTSRVHGPAPSIGFMKKGVLRLKKPV